MAGVNWVNMHGPEVDGLDVAELTRLEMNHRRHIWQSVQKIRATPGYEQVSLLETAPQLGVRITRVLAGREDGHVRRRQGGHALPRRGRRRRCLERRARRVADSLRRAGAQEKVDNVLAAGRCISAELRMADAIRVIPICWVTGHAAGVAAAVAVQDGCPVRAVEVGKVQKILKEQEAYLG